MRNTFVVLTPLLVAGEKTEFVQNTQTTSNSSKKAIIKLLGPQFEHAH